MIGIVIPIETVKVKKGIKLFILKGWAATKRLCKEMICLPFRTNFRSPKGFPLSIGLVGPFLHYT